MTQRAREAQAGAELVRRVALKGKPQKGQNYLHGLAIKAGVGPNTVAPGVASLHTGDDFRKLLGLMVSMAVRLERAETKVAAVEKALKVRA